MRITGSARRHGVDDQGISHAVDHAVCLVEVDDGMLIIGADISGRMIELLARSTEAGELIVFHAMPLRRSLARRYLS